MSIKTVGASEKTNSEMGKMGYSGMPKPKKSTSGIRKPKMKEMHRKPGAR